MLINSWTTVFSNLKSSSLSLFSAINFLCKRVVDDFCGTQIEKKSPTLGDEIEFPRNKFENTYLPTFVLQINFLEQNKHVNTFSFFY